MNILFDKESDLLHSKLPIQYQDYLNWLDEIENLHSYKLLSTSNCHIREQKDWNTLGREIYDRKKVVALAEATLEVIRDLNLAIFIAEHEYSRAVWFPAEFCFNERNSQSYKFVKQILSESKLNNFNGTFEISGYSEIKEFIEHFIDYPFLFRYRSIDFISKEVALVIKFSAHLSVDYISQNQRIVDRIKNICNENKLDIKVGN